MIIESFLINFDKGKLRVYLHQTIPQATQSVFLTCPIIMLATIRLNVWICNINFHHYLSNAEFYYSSDYCFESRLSMFNIRSFDKTFAHVGSVGKRTSFAWPFISTYKLLP